MSRRSVLNGNRSDQDLSADAAGDRRRAGTCLNELVTNANKCAYGGDAGPLTVTLVADRNLFRLIVADSGAGRTSTRVGFGSRMMDALVGQLGGTLEFEDNYPGTKATLVAPIGSKSGAKP